MVPGQAEIGQGQPAARCDLIETDGTYRTGVPLRFLEADPATGSRRMRDDVAEHAPVEQLLQLRGLYLWPLLGWLLRNHWAKSRGARLPAIPWRGSA